MHNISIKLGGLLVAISLLSWVIAGFGSPTALIPAVLGTPIVICGLLTKKNPDRTKLYMHIAVLFALLIFLGSASRIPSLDEFGSLQSVSIWASALVSFVLLGLYVQSFIKARSSKED